MLDLEQVKNVLQGIVALAALIKLRKETLSNGREPTADELQNVQVPEVSTVGFNPFIAHIAESTLDAITVVIDRARKRLDGALQDPANSRQIRDAEEEAARSTICAELARIKRLNEQNLPEEFEKIRREFECA